MNGGWTRTRTPLGSGLATVAAAIALGGCGSTDDAAGTSAGTATAAPAATTAPEPATTQGAAPTTGAAPSTTGASPSSATQAARSATAGTQGSAGDDAADEQAIRRVVARYTTAFRRGDGVTACALLNDRQRALLGSRGLGTCEQAAARAAAAMAKDEDIARTLRSLRLDTVRVDGDRAVGQGSVAVGDGRQAIPLQLERTPGGWRISSNAPVDG
jgi:hypothetical protein